ncbi:hypothetical protein ACWGST_15570 [Agromyces sp. NPDC055520]
MDTSNQGAGRPANPTDAAVTAILDDWSTPVAGDDASRPRDPSDTGDAAPVAPAPDAQPTIRWGALVWALLFGATAATTLWVLVSPVRRDLVGDWLIALNPLTAALTTVIVVGVVVALFGIVGLIRRGERARR